MKINLSGINTCFYLSTALSIGGLLTMTLTAISVGALARKNGLAQAMQVDG